MENALPAGEIQAIEETMHVITDSTFFFQFFASVSYP